MPSGTHSETLGRSMQDIWGFVSDMNNWAPLVPGYMTHDIVSDRQSTWTIKGEIGMIQKIVQLRIDITEWQEPLLVTFDLTGLNENVSGSGYFEMAMESETETQMSGNLNITAKGMMAPVMNPILKSVVPKIAERLTQKVANKLVKMEPVRE